MNFCSNVWPDWDRARPSSTRLSFFEPDDRLWLVHVGLCRFRRTPSLRPLAPAQRYFSDIDSPAPLSLEERLPLAEAAQKQEIPALIVYSPVEKLLMKQTTLKEIVNPNSFLKCEKASAKEVSQLRSFARDFLKQPSGAACMQSESEMEPVSDFVLGGTRVFAAHALSENALAYLQQHFPVGAKYFALASSVYNKTSSNAPLRVVAVALRDDSGALFVALSIKAKEGHEKNRHLLRKHKIAVSIPDKNDPILFDASFNIVFSPQKRMQADSAIKKEAANEKNPKTGEKMKYSEYAKQKGLSDLDLIERIEGEIFEGKVSPSLCSI